MDKQLKDGRTLTITIERKAANVEAVAKISGVEVARDHQTTTAPKGAPVPFALGGKVGLTTDERAVVDAMLATARTERDAQFAAMVPGWAEYERIESAYLFAAADYDRQSEHGYPVAAAAKAEAAGLALETYQAANPTAHAWAKIQGNQRASNYTKASGADAAEARVWAGQDVIAAAAQMDSEWSAEARRLVEAS